MEELTLKKKIHIGLFKQAQYMMSTIINTSLVIFYTDFIGMENNTTYGLAILIYGFWNAVNDPIFGYLSDKKVSEGGLRKPLMRKGMPLMLIGFLMTILVPPGWQDWQLFIMLFIGLIIFDFGKALSMVNYQAYNITIADTPQKRSKLNMIVSYVGFIPGALIGIVPTVFLTGDFTYRQVLGVFMGVTISFFIIARYSLTKMPESREMYEKGTSKSSPKYDTEVKKEINKSEIKTEEETKQENKNNVSINTDNELPDYEEIVSETNEPISLKQSFKHTYKSKPFRFVVLYRFLACFFQTIYYNNLIYMMNWVVDTSPIWSLLIPGAGGLIINGLYPYLTKLRKRNGTVPTIIRCFTIAIPGYIIMYFAMNIWMLLIGYSLTTVALSALYLFDPVLIGDVDDEDFLNTGHHKQGMFVSIHGFFITLASSAASFLLTYFLDFFGYDGTANFQTPYAVEGIRIISSVLPMSAVIGCILVLKFYPLQGEYYKKVRFGLADIYGIDVLENKNLLDEYKKKKDNNSKDENQNKMHSQSPIEQKLDQH